MSEQDKTKQRLEIAHVLFIDIVDYSKLLTDEQSEALHELNQIVRNTEAAHDAETAGQLTILPTGDGMALVFTGSVEEPVECALEVSQALRAQPSLPVRMGIHSGPVHHVKDANERENIAGVGINIAQRVMDCGDAGHILVSKRVADDLAQQRRWQPYLHELGDVEVKHGVVVSLVNVYAETIGNPAPPARLGKGRGRIARSGVGTSKGLSPLARSIFIVTVLLLLLAIVSVIFAPAIMRTLGQRQVATPPQPPAIPSPPSFADTIKSEVAKKITTELQDALSRKKDAEAQRQDALSRRKDLAAEQSPRGEAISEKSIAVLPFENLSDDKSNAYFADGVQEEILTRLSKIADLKVISRTSTQRYKSAPENLPEIAQQLGVANILEGSVQKAADQVRVSVQLINARNDSHLWADQYDRKLTDIFAAESEVAAKIANTLQAKLTGAEQKAIAAHPTENSEAHELYLKGRFYWNKRTEEGVRKAIEYFQQAIEKDPTYALAYTGIADCYSLEGLHIDVGSLSPSEAIPKAKAAAMKALELDDTLSEAHTSLAFIRLNYDWDWSGAESEFKRAIELKPNSSNAHHWYSHYLMAMGQIDRSLTESKRALELDPLGLIINVHLAWHYMNAHQYDLAIEQLTKALEMDPNYGIAHWYLGLCNEQKGKHSEAEAEMREAKELLKGNIMLEADTAYIYAVSGQKDQALKVIDELKELSKRRYVSSYHVAMIYIGLRQKDQAFEWLENAYRERSDLLVYLKVEPRLDSLRSDPRFKDLRRRVGLKE